MSESIGTGFLTPESLPQCLNLLVADSSALEKSLGAPMEMGIRSAAPFGYSNLANPIALSALETRLNAL